MSLDKKATSLAKFSRWLRTICTILLSRNASADRAKALNYIEQAVNVMGNSTVIEINGNMVCIRIGVAKEFIAFFC